MGIVDKIKMGAKNAGSKISEEAEVVEINSKIKDQKKEIDRVYHDMGEYYYTHRKNWSDDDKKAIDDYCGKIDECLVKIKNLEKDIEATKERGKQDREVNRRIYD